uniref:Zinc-ribbon domain-containing protein n=1 Tax=Candidatus Methanogaster sp. ANME-2c ERB4 TaxID=2759911 RepID=A0A7G9YPW4_9EURY|nr:hypothetical protein MMAJBCMK_00031 [Methanosarcinales archaeon ANME-2c ERB4]
MYCRICGKEIPEDSRFCSFCGAEQGGTVSGVSIHAGGDVYKDVSMDTGALGRESTVIVLKQDKIETVNRLFADLNSQLRSVPDISEDRRNEAISKSEELNKELIKEKPEPGKIEQLKGWLIDNVPEVAGTVTSLFINPIVGKVVEKAGKMMSERIK